MINEIKLLTLLELRNLYSINRFRYSKDKKERRMYLLLMSAWIMLGIMIGGYVVGLTYGLITLELPNIVPSYLILLASLIILAFGIFKAGNAIFTPKGYDILSSLPIRQVSIVTSRFLNLYVEDLILTFVITIPGFVVYGIMTQPNIISYVFMLIGIFFIPLIPLVISTVIGTIILAISSRMKHKSMIQTVLCIGLVVAIMIGSFQTGSFSETVTPDMLINLANTIGELIASIYPPAVWLGNTIVFGLEQIASFLLFVGISVIATIFMIVLISRTFQQISRRLLSTSATHNYKVGTLKSSNLLFALYKKEAKRYFSSSIYVTNTIIGPILGMIFAISILVTGFDTIQTMLEIPFDIRGFVPFVIAGIFTTMTTTSCSISMEGKNIWIVKTLPIPTKTILDSKILLNLSLIVPFYLITEIALIIALKPTLLDILWLILIPALLILFAVVIGITVNLKWHRFDWEKEETIVKQSLSAMLGGFAGMLVSIVCGVIVALVPQQFDTLGKTGICIVLFLITLFLYQKNNKMKF